MTFTWIASFYRAQWFYRIQPSASSDKTTSLDKNSYPSKSNYVTYNTVGEYVSQTNGGVKTATKAMIYAYILLFIHFI